MHSFDYKLCETSYVTVPLENLLQINITVVQCSALPPLKRVLSSNPIGAFLCGSSVCSSFVWSDLTPSNPQTCVLG